MNLNKEVIRKFSFFPEKVELMLKVLKQQILKDKNGHSKKLDSFMESYLSGKSHWINEDNQKIEFAPITSQTAMMLLNEWALRYEHQPTIDILLTNPHIIEYLNSLIQYWELQDISLLEMLELHKGLLIARDTIDYVRNKIKISATAPHLSLYYSGCYSSELSKKIRFRQLTMEESLVELVQVYAPENHRLREIKRVMKALENTEVGACTEYALVALGYLRSRGVHSEFLAVTNGNHALVVFKKDPGADSNNPATWGKYCVICDAMENKYYPKDHIYQKLECAVEVKDVPDTAEYPNIYYPYNPTFHQLKLVPFYIPQSILVNGEQLLNEAKDKIRILEIFVQLYSEDREIMHILLEIKSSINAMNIENLLTWEIEDKINLLLEDAMKKTLLVTHEVDLLVAYFYVYGKENYSEKAFADYMKSCIRKNQRGVLSQRFLSAMQNAESAYLQKLFLDSKEEIFFGPTFKCQ